MWEIGAKFDVPIWLKYGSYDTDFHQTHNRWTISFGDSLYQISPKSGTKYGQYEWKFIVTIQYNCTCHWSFFTKLPVSNIYTNFVKPRSYDTDFHQTHNRWTISFGDSLYQISPKSVTKYGQYEWKFIVTIQYKCTCHWSFFTKLPVSNIYTNFVKPRRRIGLWYYVTDALEIHVSVIFYHFRKNA